MKPVLLDLFCCAGGATRGYQEAGFHVVGVDIAPQPNYIGDAFHLGDAIQLVPDLVREYSPSLIHASPPCQGYTALKAVHRNTHPMLIPATRDALDATGLPYVIENVAGAPIAKHMMLCGEMFKLGVLQHRFFEMGLWRAVQPVHPPHRGRVRGWRHGQYYDGPYVAVHGAGGGKATVPEAQKAKGIDWTTNMVELCEAIPPAYTWYIGNDFLGGVSI
jgi:hypothetical protein